VYATWPWLNVVITPTNFANNLVIVHPCVALSGLHLTYCYTEQLSQTCHKLKQYHTQRMVDISNLILENLSTCGCVPDHYMCSCWWCICCRQWLEKYIHYIWVSLVIMCQLLLLW